jgi:hypothetical protein
MFRICADDANEMHRRNAQRNIGGAKVYFMFWNNMVKVKELFEGLFQS